MSFKIADNKKSLAKAVIWVSISAFFIFGPSFVLAKTGDYQAKLMIRNTTDITLNAGEKANFKVGFKNIGAKTWYTSGKNAMRLHTISPFYRSSVIYCSSWESKYTLAYMDDKSLKPGQIGYFQFTATAPKKAGVYTENFQLITQDGTYVNGGKLQLTIRVVNSGADSIAKTDTKTSQLDSSNIATNANTNNATLTNYTLTNDNYSAKIISQPVTKIKIDPGKAITYEIEIQNLGQNEWKKDGENQIVLYTVNSVGQASEFRHNYWKTDYIPTTLSENVKPGQTIKLRFALQAPSVDKNFQENFRLIVKSGEFVKNSDFSIDIQVGNPKTEVKLVDTSDQNLPDAMRQLQNVDEHGIQWADQKFDEPIVRVGLYNTKEPIKITADKPFRIIDGQGALLADLVVGEFCIVNFNFEIKTYELICPNMTNVGTSYLRFEPKEDQTVMEILNFKDSPKWNGDINDNKFRNILEIRYSENTGKLWVINELKMEDYLKGLAETSDISPYEYHKAIVTAARTYAMYHYTTGTKHASEYFTLDADLDQVYRGYNSELRLPNIVRAVEETKGNMVTYNNGIVVTPYFAQSDGRTRSWEEVWFGSAKPWLKSKLDPYCQGMALWGHGVGMSARGALNMANQGQTFDQILKYYYDGIELKRFY